MSITSKNPKLHTKSQLYPESSTLGLEKHYEILSFLDAK